MKIIYDEFVDETKHYVFDLLNRELPESLLYHTIDHTIEVLRNAEIIGKHNNLDNNTFNKLRLSCLFHDVGFIEICDGHEEVSVIYAEKYFNNQKLDKELIREISQAIMATRVPQSPIDLISQILCDADLMNLSYEMEYLDDVELLRKEWINCGKEAHSKKEFYQISLDFFKTHHFHTEYGHKILKPKKDKTEKILIDKLNNSPYL